MASGKASRGKKAEGGKKREAERNRLEAPTGGPDEPVRVLLAAAPSPVPLPSEALRWTCDPGSLPFRSTADLEPVADVIGQEQAMEALRFGLAIDAPGQNIFVRGLEGTGRMTLVRRLLDQIKLSCPLARDRCYVHNFSQPHHPRLITLQRGQGRAFARHVDDLVDFIHEDLERALSSDALRGRRLALDRETQRKIEEATKPFEQAVREAGLTLVNIRLGPATQAALLPVIDGKAISPEEWETLRSEGKITDEQAAAYQQRVASFQGPLGEVMARTNEIQRQYAQAVRELRSKAVHSVLEDFIEGVIAEFADPAIGAFLDELVDDVALRRSRDGEGDDDDRYRWYRVNVLVCREADESCPIVVENTPTMSNLLGTIDRSIERSGPGRSDHAMISAGSLLRADGGYLIADARELLREPGAWRVLVRTLRTGCLEIVPAELTMPWWGPSLKPEPIDVSVKVILLGDAETYYLLDAYDTDFPYLFKVLADFGSVIPRNEQSIAQYGGVLTRIAREEDLPPFDAGAVAALVEQGARIAGHRKRLTTRFGRLADIAHEAAFLATKQQHKEVTGDDVRAAIRAAKKRAELPSQRFREFLADGTIQVATRGAVVGQVNGLAVTHAGPLVYGFPARITASIGPGSAGVVNIEGEARLSGRVHTKGFHILGGLLRFLLRTDHPLTFHASITFEQSYGGIDGDSASGAETCCLLSTLTEVPLRQDLAFTGAVDQVGHVLAVGAVNEKIEGFFDTCRDLTLTGTQGVIIPESNAPDLMLRPDVVEACRAGKFHVYTVETVHQAIELLTGIVAGERDELGQYSEDTLLGLAVAKAFEYWVKAIQGLEMLAALPNGEGTAGDGQA